MTDNAQSYKQGEIGDNHNTQLLLALSIMGNHSKVHHADFKEEDLDNISTSTLVERLLPGTQCPSEE